ncbi:MAG: hypothetical protein ACI9LO_001315 [Planctomycetota bacterium]|jgi:hypothetical protein
MHLAVFSYLPLGMRHVHSLLLLAMIMVSAFPVYAATETSTIAVKIVRIITMTNRNGLIFGDISSSSVAGTVVLSPNGSRDTTGGASINSTVASGPAAFDVVGEPNSTYTVTLPGVVILNATSGDIMVVDNFASFQVNGLTDSGGGESLFVGATLNVGANQSFGSYSGIMSVTIGYN